MHNHLKYHSGDAHTFIRSSVSFIAFIGNVHVHIAQFQIVIRVMPREHASVCRVCVVQKNCVLSPVVAQLLYMYWGKSLDRNTCQSSGGHRPIACTHRAFTLTVTKPVPTN